MWNTQTSATAETTRTLEMGQASHKALAAQTPKKSTKFKKKFMNTADIANGDHRGDGGDCAEREDGEESGDCADCADDVLDVDYAKVADTEEVTNHKDGAAFSTKRMGRMGS